MIGFIGLIEAEDLALDVPNGDAWRESTQPTLIAGESFTTTLPPSKTITKSVAGGLLDTDFLIYDDLPMDVVDASGDPIFIVNRSTSFDGTVTDWYLLTGEDQYKAFNTKRSHLLTAFNKLCGLPGYTITASTPADANLQRAQLLCAIQSRDSGLDFYKQLAGLGVKREKRGDAETEFHTPAEQKQTDLLGEVIDLLKGYKETTTFGPVLKPDETMRQGLQYN